MCAQVVRAVERGRAHAESFHPEDEAVLRGEDDPAADTESEYSADLPDSQPALRLAMRARTGRVASAAVLDEATGKAPTRSVLEYELPAAALPPPFQGCLQVHEVPLGTATAIGLPQWDVYMRVRLQAAHGLPCSTIHGTLLLRLPDSAPLLAACSVKASYVKAKNLVRPSTHPLAAVLCAHGPSSRRCVAKRGDSGAAHVLCAAAVE